MKVLHVDSSILGPGSVSRQLSNTIIDRIKSAHRHATITYRDLASQPLNHLSGAYLTAAQNPGGEHEPIVAADLAQSREVLTEFLEADVIVIGVAFYNFGISSQLKSWIDRILIAGQTFRYGADGPEGLVGDKTVYLAIARGGFYGDRTPMSRYEHAESHLRAVLAFIGVYNPEIVVAEGIAVGPEQREKALQTAIETIKKLSV